jgi:hypothetical protein
MRETEHREPLLHWQQDDFSQALATPGGLSQFRRILRDNRLMIGFANGYGVTIIPVSREGDEEVLEMLVLRFFGAGVMNFRVAQYIPIPELNRGNFTEIIHLCRQIAALPPRAAITGHYSESPPEGKRDNQEQHCSNFR